MGEQSDEAIDGGFGFGSLVLEPVNPSEDNFAVHDIEHLHERWDVVGWLFGERFGGSDSHRHGPGVEAFEKFLVGK